MPPRRRNAVSSVASAASPRPFSHRRAPPAEGLSARITYSTMWDATGGSIGKRGIHFLSGKSTPVFPLRFQAFKTFLNLINSGCRSNKCSAGSVNSQLSIQPTQRCAPGFAPELFTTDGFTSHATCISFDAPAHPPTHFHCNTVVNRAWSRNRRASRTGRSYGSLH